MGPPAESFPTETLSTRIVGRLAAALWIGCGLLVALTVPIVKFPSDAHPGGVIVVGGAALATGVAIFFAPWDHWPRSATLLVVPFAFTAIALYSIFSRDDGVQASLFYIASFVWLGLGHRRGTSIALAPVLAVAFLLPILVEGNRWSLLQFPSVIYVVPCCVLLGETVAWVSNRLRRSEAALAMAEARFRSAFEQAPIGMGMATLDGRLIQVNQAFADVIGREPADLAGVSIRDITHPDDWETNAYEIQRIVDGEADRYNLEKRYRHADGRYVWVSICSSAVRDQSGKALYMIGQLEDITERRAMQEHLAHAATHDLLTGLPNRVVFMDRLEQALRRSERKGGHVALMFMDVDKFKMVNDSLGHDVGDRALQELVKSVGSVLRSSDTLARFGGDEFTVLCEVGDEGEAVDIAQRILAALAYPLTMEGHDLFQSLSIGIALSAGHHQSGADLLRNADLAMYRAKSSGPGHFALFEVDDEVAAIGRLQTSTELHRALERNEFELYYQPVVELHRTTLVGMEALIRWNHPDRGLLLPGDFISIAEEGGLIERLGEFVLTEACRQGALWSQRRSESGLDKARINISVNVSGRQLQHRTFRNQVREALDRSAFDPDQLWLEITESTLMGNADDVILLLHELRDLGVHLEIDDFGTGYSSLSYLKRFPVETLKIDRCFIAEVDRDPEDVAIVEAILALADSMHLSVVAEGVERAEQAQELEALGCFLAQGFYYGRPIPARSMEPFPADDLSTWLRTVALTA